MKKFLNVLLCAILIFTAASETVGAEVISGGTNNPVTRDEVQIGTITGFDTEDGDFGTTVYYIRMQNRAGREVSYPLADKTYLNYELMKAKNVYDILQSGYSRIAYVVRNEEIKYINPYVINYGDKRNITISKGSNKEISVEIFGTGESTEVKWTSDSKIIFEFAETSGVYNETVTIKGKIVGNATLTAELYVDNELADSINFEINVTGSVISAGSNGMPVSPDKVQSGIITGFEVEDGDFGDDIYYLNLMTENGEERIELAKHVIFTYGVYTSEDAVWILQNSESDITFVTKSGKIQYINPYIPEGLFESAEIDDCYSVDGTTYGYLMFEYLVGECVCLVAVYDSDNSLCSVTHFDVSYKDAYSYDFELPTNDGEYVKLFFLKDIESIQPLEEYLTAQIDIVR